MIILLVIPSVVCFLLPAGERQKPTVREKMGPQQSKRDSSRYPVYFYAW